MKSTQLKALPKERLVQQFMDLARLMGAAILDSETKRFNRLFPKMQAIDRELRTRGPEARTALLPLLDTRDRFIRYYAAKYTLGLAPDRARRVIEDIEKSSYDALRLDAGMCLYALDEGIFKPD